MILALIALLLVAITPRLSMAHCPLCLIATGSTVAIAKSMGVSDLAVGTLMGGFTIASALWLAKIAKKKWKKEYVAPVIVLGSIGLTIGSYIVSGTLSQAARVIPGVDDMTAGTIIGSVIALAAFILHARLRAVNGNKSFVPFQAIVLVIASMALSVVVYGMVGLR